MEQVKIVKHSTIECSAEARLVQVGKAQADRGWLMFRFSWSRRGKAGRLGLNKDRATASAVALSINDWRLPLRHPCLLNSHPCLLYQVRRSVPT